MLHAGAVSGVQPSRGEIRSTVVIALDAALIWAVTAREPNRT
ncbi:hypothetical protein [Nocardia sp. NPDC050793]